MNAKELCDKLRRIDCKHADALAAATLIETQQAEIDAWRAYDTREEVSIDVAWRMIKTIKAACAATDAIIERT